MITEQDVRNLADSGGGIEPDAIDETTAEHYIAANVIVSCHPFGWTLVPETEPEPVGIPTEPPKILTSADLPANRPEPRARKVASPEAPNPASKIPGREVEYRCAVMDYPGLSIGARYAGVAIVRHCFSKREFFAGTGKLAGWMGLSPNSRKHVAGYVDELEAAGFLVAIGKAGRATRYRLTIPA